MVSIPALFSGSNKAQTAARSLGYSPFSSLELGLSGQQVRCLFLHVLERHPLLESLDIFADLGFNHQRWEISRNVCMAGVRLKTVRYMEQMSGPNTYSKTYWGGQRAAFKHAHRTEVGDDIATEVAPPLDL